MVSNRFSWRVRGEGATGPQGPTGPQGAIGPHGPAGSQGPQGVARPAGPQVAAGPQGVASPQGAAGAQGPAAVLSTAELTFLQQNFTIAGGGACTVRNVGGTGVYIRLSTRALVAPVCGKASADYYNIECPT